MRSLEGFWVVSWWQQEALKIFEKTQSDVIDSLKGPFQQCCDGSERLHAVYSRWEIIFSHTRTVAMKKVRRGRRWNICQSRSERSSPHSACRAWRKEIKEENHCCSLSNRKYSIPQIKNSDDGVDTGGGGQQWVLDTFSLRCLLDS